MVSFVNIITGQFWDFESWDKIKQLGGLNKLLPEKEWQNIYNDKAAEETLRLSFLQGSNRDLTVFFKTIELFKNRKQTLNKKSNLMEKQKMTIHRALSELKLIDAKIVKQTTELIPSGYYQKGKLVMGYMKEEEFNEAAQSKYDSIINLINRKVDIKSAIVLANSITDVTVGGKSMTIADAITYKGVIAFKQALIATLKQKHLKAVGDLNNNNNIVEQNVQRLLEATFGKENVKVGKEDVEAVRKPYIEANTFFLLDPLGADKKIAELEKEVAEFQAEVDAVLSEINAVTFIEI